MTDLLPCPFCGGGAAHGLWGDRRMAVRCFRCDAGGPTTEVVPEVCIEIRPFIEQAIAAWNRRAAPASPAERQGPDPGKPTEHLSDLRQRIARIIDPWAMAFKGYNSHAMSRREDALSKADAILALGEGSDSSVARADMTPPSGAPAETEGH